MKNGLLWIRNDLRVSDNPTLQRALRECNFILPVFIFEDRIWRIHKTGKIGNKRAQFILESLEDLNQSYQKLGSSIHFMEGEAVAIIPNLMDEYCLDICFAQKEYAHEETTIEKVLSKQINLQLVDSHTLLAQEDLPFLIEDLPENFTKFRKKVEENWSVREVIASPKKIKTKKPSNTLLPSLSDLAMPIPTTDKRSVLLFKGGEIKAWQRVNQWMWQKKCLSKYKETRNELIGPDYSSKFSPWLSTGCISSRQVYQEVCKFEAKHGKNESTYWLVFELLWRDFFQFAGLKNGHRLFCLGGIKGRKFDTEKSPNLRLLNQWKNGATGDAFVDANMRELVATGWMSNRGRQNVASCLIHELKLDWRLGASYFESHLIDYDPCSNYGNWLYLAGRGNDPRPDRKFNTSRQAEVYDPEGLYRKLWENS